MILSNLIALMGLCVYMYIQIFIYVYACVLFFVFVCFISEQFDTRRRT